MKPVPFTRRNMLLGAAAVGAVGVGVGAYGLSGDALTYFTSMFRHYLPGVTISDEGLRNFTREATEGRNEDFGPKLKALAGAVRVFGFSAVSAAMAKNYAFDKFNREFFSLFLMNSNFFQLDDPREGIVEYYGLAAACGNPFAEFSSPPT